MFGSRRRKNLLEISHLFLLKSDFDAEKNHIKNLMAQIYFHNFNEKKLIL